MSWVEPELPDPLVDLPAALLPQWEQMQKHFPKHAFVVAVERQNNLWRLHLTGDDTLHAGLVLLWT